MSRLRLDRPVVFFDLETTGTDPSADRIVEISALRLHPDGSTEIRTRRLNPERPIPPEATAVHGIGDDDVRDEPAFRRIARSLLEFLEGADLAGFNVRRFDVPLLEREFRDCGLDLGLDRRAVIDVMTIFHRKEPRDLSAATRFYLDRDHAGAHDAEADVRITREILEAQLDRYDDLPDTVAELDRWCTPVPADAVDREGKFVWHNGRAVFNFGRFRGQTLDTVAAEQPDYLEWIARSDFPADARELVRLALTGEFPSPARSADDQST